MNKAALADESPRDRRPRQQPPAIEQLACYLCGDDQSTLIVDRSNSVAVVLCEDRVAVVEAETA